MHAQWKASQLADHCRFCAVVVPKGETVCKQGECTEKLKMRYAIGFHTVLR